MKRTLVLLVSLLISAAMMTGFTGEVAEMKNCKTYENTAQKITFQYPERWTEISKDKLQSDTVVSKMAKELDMTKEELSAMLSSATVLFYDTGRGTETFASNFNLVADTSKGSTAALAKDQTVIKELKIGVEAQYKTMFQNFSWVQEPVHKKHGDTDYIIMQVKYTFDGAEVTAFQALTFGTDMNYVFTYSAGKPLSSRITTTLEAILASVKIG